MIHVIYYSYRHEYFPSVKRMVDECCEGMNCIYMSFQYSTDILDYLNNTQPKRAAVFYLTDDIADGLKIAHMVNGINSKYRFNLVCRDSGEAENLFYNGVTYFIKEPFSFDSIERCAEFFKKYYDTQSGNVLLLKNKTGTEAIEYSNINYIMSDKRKITVHSTRGEHSFYCKLDEIENMLGSGFLRCHQSFIVNMQKIKTFVDDGLLLYDESFIPVSRSKYYPAKKAYLSYITGEKIM